MPFAKQISKNFQKAKYQKAKYSQRTNFARRLKFTYFCHIFKPEAQTYIFEFQEIYWALKIK
jgi:hypothetical protein